MAGIDLTYIEDYHTEVGGKSILIAENKYLKDCEFIFTSVAVKPLK